MSDMRFEFLPPVVHEVVDTVTPFFEQLDTGRFALGLGGSLSRGTWDTRSDIDFRLYHERPLPRPNATVETWREYFVIVDYWAQQGVRLDGIWCRTIADVEAKLDAWLAGNPAPEPLHWTVWGYHLLPDISQQIAVLDSEGIIARWHVRLETYPKSLADALVMKHLNTLRYWRNDYHYRHKVERGDVVFLASLSTKLVHDLIQLLCAINGVPFPGDGNNLRLADELPIRPGQLRERITAALYPVPSETMLTDQHETLLQLIDDTEALVAGDNRF